MVLLRRLFGIILLMFFALTASAQWTLSADLSYSSSNYNYTRGSIPAFNSELPKGHTFAVSPRVGYVLSDIYEAGLQLSYVTDDYEYTHGYYVDDKREWLVDAVTDKSFITFGASAYLRATCCRHGALSACFEFVAGYAFGYGGDYVTSYSASNGREINSRYDKRGSQFSFQVVPVLNYAFNAHISLDAYINALSLCYLRNATTTFCNGIDMDGYDIPDPQVYDKTVTSQFDLGLHALNTSLVTLGIGYQF